MRLAGESATVALLQSNSALIDGVVNDLAHEAITDVITPSLALLTVLLEKGLFSRIAESLQIQFLLSLRRSSPPTLLSSNSYTGDSTSDAKHIVDARSLLIPATASLLVSQGCFAQAADLCFFHLKAHPAFANLEFGLHLLPPYIRENQRIFRTYTASPQVLNCAVPNRFDRLCESLDTIFEDCIIYMQEHNVDQFN